MRTAVIFIAGILLMSACFADSAAPYHTNLLSGIDNLDVNIAQWSLSNGILSKNSPLYYGDKFLVVKEDIVKIPVWYFLTCDLVNIRRQNDKLPEAGLLFGFVDDKNYWSLTTGQELSKPIIKLIQMKNGAIVLETTTQLEMEYDQTKIGIAVEVHHQAWVKVYAGNRLLLTHETSGEIAQGRVGLILQSGICDFTNVTISGIAKQ
jgi:hypothetical protein